MICDYWQLIRCMHSYMFGSNGNIVRRKQMTGTVLILGQSGRFGRNAAQAFAQAGWHVRGFDRAKDTLLQAAMGVDVIVNAWNPAYTDWAAQVPKLHAQVRAAAKAADATVILPGNVYVFGPQTASPWSDTSPHQAENSLGRIRIEMEQAYRRDGVKTIILRAGDFIDTEASGSWFDEIMIKSLAKGKFTYPGAVDMPHAWAFLPDLARAAVALAEQRDQLPVFADIPFAGYALSGREVAATLSGITGQPVTAKQMAWWPLVLASPFWKMGRYLMEMRYLWNTPHRLDGSTFDRLVPDFKITRPEVAFSQAIAG
jgi:nucleoside-diphosphate-sugar epimerase